MIPLADEAATYLIVKDTSGLSIICLTCGMASHNPNDIEQRYCGHCHKFHEARTDI